MLLMENGSRLKSSSFLLFFSYGAVDAFINEHLERDDHLAHNWFEILFAHML